ncbi:MAG TPA: CBS domain-containing protein [Leptolyngbyaceae cyanobacterium M33_DOE_097]|uniref:CBS domain-containing protein n=1 Tax=Oscillatoriales cyanobacterium SpSt-418 TaxID=2282169 RepID=A0A7C3KFA8_9CYAN|nr:CBS domain-containing protein [Leptolyngbyaceae cyanobacterium M33_DOE_097]
MKAQDIMTQEVATIRGSATVADAVKLMKLKKLRSLVVDRRYEEDAYGLMTEEDITNKVVAYGKDPKELKVYEVMTKPCVVVNPDLAVEYVARLFALTGIDRAPVIRGDLLGIISVTDILFKSDFLSNPRLAILERALAEANAAARAIAQEQGEESEAYLKAWEKVEELQAEASHLRSGITPKVPEAQVTLSTVPEAVSV